jgi:hypothetical protein
VADENDRPALRVDGLPRRCDVTLERQRRVLHDGDVVAVLLEQVVDPLPSGPVHESAVHENDISR